MENAFRDNNMNVQFKMKTVTQNIPPVGISTNNQADIF